LKDLTDNLDGKPPATAKPLYAWQLPEAIQGYVHDLTFTSVDQDTVTWASGTITFYDGTTQAIASGTTGNIANTTLRYIYFDLDDASPNVLKVATIDDYISTYLSVRTGVVCLVKKGSAAGINATVLPSYGKEPLITADAIHMAGLLEVDLGSGAKLQAILSTQIYAGLLKLTADTVKDGEWYDQTGVVLDATRGIGIYGGQIAFEAFPTKTDYTNNTNRQIYIGTDGKLYAGAGTVILDSGGLQIKDDGNALIYSGATLVGAIGAQTGTPKTFYISAATGARLELLGIVSHIRFEPSTDEIQITGSDVVTVHGDRVNLGAGTADPAGADNSIVLYAENDVTLYADDDVIIAPDGVTTISNLTIDRDSGVTRTVGTVYHNTGDCPILVTLIATCDDGEGIQALCDSDSTPSTLAVRIMNDTGAGRLVGSGSFIVPVDWYYKLDLYSHNAPSHHVTEYGLGNTVSIAAI